MNCEVARDRFSSLWEKELAPSEEKILKGHLSSCPECQREFEQFEKTMGWLHSIGEVEVPPGFLEGLSKKREEKKGAIPGEKSEGRWFQFPLSFKLPAQAVAMVAIVFLVLYLTKMIPMEGFLKETKQTSSPFSVQEKPERGLTRPAAPGPISEGKVEKRHSESTRGEPSPSVRQSHRPEQGRVTGSGVEGLTQKGEKPRVSETSKETPYAKDAERAKSPVPAPPPKAGIMAYEHMESKEEGRERAPSPEPGKMKRELALREKSLIASKPPQEIVLKISDRKKVIPRLHELVRKFGGDVVETEGDRLLASLPTGSFSEFEKELARFISSAKADQLIAKKDAAGSLGLEKGAKREEGDEKSKGSARLAADTGSRTIVRILLVEE